MNASITIDKDFCKGCLFCIEFCPKKVIQLSEQLNVKGYHYAEYKGEGCIGCANCAVMCPEVAIEVYRA
jgi:NAD-dependent dihydropyrimidine dehydrogenase PreA subunit